MKIQSIGNEYRAKNYKHSNQYSLKQPAFGRAWEEHISWGANYIKDKNKTNFKLFSFPDAKAVFLEVTKNAKLKLTDWWEHSVKIKEPETLAAATTAAAIAAITPLDNQSKMFPMEHTAGVLFMIKIIMYGKIPTGLKVRIQDGLNVTQTKQ